MGLTQEEGPLFCCGRKPGGYQGAEGRASICQPPELSTVSPRSTAVASGQGLPPALHTRELPSSPQPARRAFLTPPFYRFPPLNLRKHMKLPKVAQPVLVVEIVLTRIQPEVCVSLYSEHFIFINLLTPVWRALLLP